MQKIFNADVVRCGERPDRCAAPDDDVVDADFEEVKDDAKK
jgi:hypothetical protein